MFNHLFLGLVVLGGLGSPINNHSANGSVCLKSNRLRDQGFVPVTLVSTPANASVLRNRLTYNAVLTLAGAPSTDQAVAIFPSNASSFAALPAFVIVRAGQTSAGFQATLSSQAGDSASIFASALGVTVQSNVMEVISYWIP